MSASNYFENKLLDSILGSNALFSRPATLYIALFTTAPTDSSAGVEVDSGSTVYARCAFDNDSVTFSPTESRVKASEVQFEFDNPVGEGNWGTVTAYGIFDAPTGGNMLTYSLLISPRSIVAGDIVRFDVGGVSFEVFGRCGSYLAGKLLDHAFGGPSMARPGTVYLALYDIPIDAEEDLLSATEVSGGGYARLAITNNNTNWPTAVSGEKSNGAALAFPTASGDWGDVAGWAIYDAASGGNLLFVGTLSTPRTVLNGDTINFPIGSVSITCD